MSAVTDEHIAQAQVALNLRPKKYIGYRQPEVVFDELRGTAKFSEWCTSDLNLRAVKKIRFKKNLQ